MNETPFSVLRTSAQTVSAIALGLIAVAALRMSFSVTNSKIVDCVEKASHTEEMTPKEYFSRIDFCLSLDD